MELYLNRGVNKINKSSLFNTKELSAFCALGTNAMPKEILGCEQEPSTSLVIYDAGTHTTESKRFYAILENPHLKHI